MEVRQQPVRPGDRDKNCTGGALKVNGKSVSSASAPMPTPSSPSTFPKVTPVQGPRRPRQRRHQPGLRFHSAILCVHPKAARDGYRGRRGGNVSREAADAIAGLDIAPGLEATLFSSEPQISNITNIDIDHLGRVWAAEVKNYRKFNGSRPEGDRILVLEDTNGDGKGGQETVFTKGGTSTPYTASASSATASSSRPMTRCRFSRTKTAI